MRRPFCNLLLETDDLLTTEASGGRQSPDFLRVERRHTAGRIRRLTSPARRVRSRITSCGTSQTPFTYNGQISYQRDANLDPTLDESAFLLEHRL